MGNASSRGIAPPEACFATRPVDRWCDGVAAASCRPTGAGRTLGRIRGGVPQRRAPREDRSHLSGRHTRVARAAAAHLDSGTGARKPPAAGLATAASIRDREGLGPDESCLTRVMRYRSESDQSEEVWIRKGCAPPAGGAVRCAAYRRREVSACCAANVPAVPRAKCGFVKEDAAGRSRAARHENGRAPRSSRQMPATRCVLWSS